MNVGELGTKFWLSLLGVLACFNLIGSLIAFSVVQFSTSRECQQYYDKPVVKTILAVSLMMFTVLFVVLGIKLSGRHLLDRHVVFMEKKQVRIIALIVSIGSAGLIAALSGYVISHELLRFYVQSRHLGCSAGKSSIYELAFHLTWPMILLALNSFLVGLIKRYHVSVSPV